MSNKPVCLCICVAVYKYRYKKCKGPRNDKSYIMRLWVVLIKDAYKKSTIWRGNVLIVLLLLLVVVAAAVVVVVVVVVGAVVIVVGGGVIVVVRVDNNTQCYGVLYDVVYSRTNDKNYIIREWVELEWPQLT